MLRFLSGRKRSRNALLIFFVAILALSLIGFFSGGPSAIMGSSRADTASVAKVGGYAVTVKDMRDALSRFSSMITQGQGRIGGQSVGDTYMQYGPQVLDSLIRDRLVLHETDRLNLGATDAEVQSRLKRLFTPWPGYERYRDTLAQQGMTPVHFEDNLRATIAMEHLRSYITAAIRVSEEEIRDDFSRNNTTYTVRWAEVNPTSFRDKVQVAEPDLRAYFDQNKAQFHISSEQRRIDRPSDGAGEAQTSPFPIWQAFDQDAGLFLYTADGTTSKQRAVRTVRIVAPGQDPPVATIHCKEQCNLVDRSFGPGPDEVTVFEPEYPLVKRVRPSACCTVHVYGFDGVLRDRFDLAGVMNGAGIADLEWSPDGSRLAISTFSGGPMEPGCPEGDCETSEASLWIMERAGGDPVLMYKQSVPFEPSEWNNPMLMNLAWSPDGERVGFVATSWLPERADPPTLVGFDVESGQAQTLYEFDDCGTCNPTRWGFAWSPDGTRIAVTNGDRIAQLSSDGTTTYAPLGNGAGPLAWLARPRE